LISFDDARCKKSSICGETKTKVIDGEAQEKKAAAAAAEIEEDEVEKKENKTSDVFDRNGRKNDFY